MNNGTKLNLATEANGTVIISNDNTRITIQPDGTIAISSYDPIQLTGATLAKLDKCNVDSQALGAVVTALGSRLEKKTAN